MSRDAKQALAGVALGVVTAGIALLCARCSPQPIKADAGTWQVAQPAPGFDAGNGSLR